MGVFLLKDPNNTTLIGTGCSFIHDPGPMLSMQWMGDGEQAGISDLYV